MKPNEREDPRIVELLHRWEELQELGHAPDAEDLCRNSPELLEELMRQVNLLNNWNRFDSDSTKSAASVALDDWHPATVSTLALPDEWRLRERFEQFVKSGAANRSILGEGERYTIVGTLGSGGMGHVFLAQDHDLRREVAIKTTKDWNNSDRFLREAQLTAQLNHPNVLPIFDMGAVRNAEISITMPRLRGVTLKKTLSRCKGEERLEHFPELIDILLKVCDAVEYAHHRGVVHRDIKPSNVLVGDFGEVYLIDWGLAAEKDREGDPAKEVKPAYVGTPAYMAPEQARGEARKDVGVDVFGLGGMLYEILFDRTPNNIVEAVREREVGSGARYERDFSSPVWPVPQSLVRVCKRALADRPEDRFSSAAEMSKAIVEARERHLRGASTRVIVGLVIGLVTLTLSVVGLVTSLTGWSAVHWTFWGAWTACSLGLSVATIMEATGTNTPLLRLKDSHTERGRAHTAQAHGNPRYLDSERN